MSTIDVRLDAWDDGTTDVLIKRGGRTKWWLFAGRVTVTSVLEDPDVVRDVFVADPCTVGSVPQSFPTMDAAVDHLVSLKD